MRYYPKNGRSNGIDSADLHETTGFRVSEFTSLGSVLLVCRVSGFPFGFGIELGWPQAKLSVAYACSIGARLCAFSWLATDSCRRLIVQAGTHCVGFRQGPGQG